LPDVPSFAETGLPGFDLVIWNAFAAQAATPAPVIARLAEAIEGAQQDPVLQGRLRDLASTAPAPAARGPEALRRRIAADIAKWTEIIGASGLIWNSGAWVIKGQALPERPSSTGWRAITYRIIFCCHCAWTLLNLAQDREQKHVFGTRDSTCCWRGCGGKPSVGRLSQPKLALGNGPYGAASYPGVIHWHVSGGAAFPKAWPAAARGLRLKLAQSFAG